MGFIGNLFGGGGSQNNNEKQANNLLNANSQTGAAQANTAFGQGTNFLNSSQPNFAQAGTAFSVPMNFFQALLSGDQGKAMSVLSPQIQQINQANENQRRAAATFAPLGGGRSGQMAAMPFQRESQISNLYSSLLPGAAQGLTGIGAGLTGLAGTQGGLGVGMTNAGSNLLSGSNNAANAMYQNALQRAAQGNQQASAFGQGLMSLLTLPFGGGTSSNGLMGLFGGGGGGGFDSLGLPMP